MRNGIRAVVQVGFKNVHIKGDIKTLIQAVQSYVQVPLEIQVSVHDIHSYYKLCNHVIVNHIFRDDNHTVNCLTKFGIINHSTVLWN